MILQIVMCLLDYPPAMVCVVQPADKPVLRGALRLYLSMSCLFTNPILCKFFTSTSWVTLLSRFWTNIIVVDIFISWRLVENFSTCKKRCKSGNVYLDGGKSFYITTNLGVLNVFLTERSPFSLWMSLPLNSCSIIIGNAIAKRNPLFSFPLNYSVKINANGKINLSGKTETPSWIQKAVSLFQTCFLVGESSSEREHV